MMCSIIIPALNEEKRIGGLLSAIKEIPTTLEIEIIVVDGGSQDRTVECAQADSRVEILPEGNRGKQLAYGASLSQGELLWFLHADSQLPKGDVFQEMLAILKAKKCAAGFFPLCFYDNQQWFFRYLQGASNWRAQYLGLIFGDQGLFLWKSTYQQAGGFSEVPLMEDWLLSRQLRKLGAFSRHSQSIGTSARRFVDGGKWRTHFHMHYLKLRFLLGVSPEKLASNYHREKGKGKWSKK